MKRQWVIGTRFELPAELASIPFSLRDLTYEPRSDTERSLWREIFGG